MPSPQPSPASGRGGRHKRSRSVSDIAHPGFGRSRGRPASVQSSEDRYGGDAVVRRPAEIVREAEIDPRKLPLPGPEAQLRVDLVGHAQPRRADRVAKALEAAIELSRDAATAVEPPVEN